MMNHPTPLFIDEVQKETSILEEIKIAVDRSEERGNFLLSGSSKLLLMKGVSESLSGRVSVNELLGLSLREIFDVKFNKHFVGNEEYIKEREKELKNIQIFGKLYIEVLIQNYTKQNENGKTSIPLMLLRI